MAPKGFAFEYVEGTLCVSVLGRADADRGPRRPARRDGRAGAADPRRDRRAPRPRRRGPLGARREAGFDGARPPRTPTGEPVPGLKVLRATCRRGDCVGIEKKILCVRGVRARGAGAGRLRRGRLVERRRDPAAPPTGGRPAPATKAAPCWAPTRPSPTTSTRRCPTRSKAGRRSTTPTSRCSPTPTPTAPRAAR